MNRSTETRLRKLETVTDEQVSSIIIASDQAEADQKLKLYKGSQPPLVILTGVPRDNIAKLMQRVAEHGRSIHDKVFR